MPAPPPLDPLALAEYRALRATIRQRGTMRLIVIVVTFLAWAGLSIAVMSLLVVPILGLVPLAVLAAGFEVVFAAHVGVERVGRFIQVHYEPDAGLPGWEHAAMSIGQLPQTKSGIDPLFAGLFTAATLLNLVPIALLSVENGPMIASIVPLELGVYGLLHLAFVARLAYARNYAARQRERDLALFERAKKSTD
jgi:hypothetical protein